MGDSINVSRTNNTINTQSTHSPADDTTFLLKSPNSSASGAKMMVGTGTIAVATAGTQVTATINFPTAFAATPIYVLVTIAGLSVGSAGYVVVEGNSPTTAHFTLIANSYVAQTITYNYIAIGE